MIFIANPMSSHFAEGKIRFQARYVFSCCQKDDQILMSMKLRVSLNCAYLINWNSNFGFMPNFPVLNVANLVS